MPLGLFLGTTYGWHIPFLALVVVGIPVLGLAYFALPPLNQHAKSAEHPLRSLLATFREKNHLNAFALIGALSIGGFAVIPYISPYLVSNVGMEGLFLVGKYANGESYEVTLVPHVVLSEQEKDALQQATFDVRQDNDD